MTVLILATEFLPYDFAVWCEAKLVTVTIDSPKRRWKPNNMFGAKWIRSFHESDDAYADHNPEKEVFHVLRIT